MLVSFGLHRQFSIGILESFLESGYLYHEILLSFLFFIVQDKIVFVHSLQFGFLKVYITELPR